MTPTTLDHREFVPAGWSDGLDVPAVLAGQGIDPHGRGARLAAVQSAASRALAEGRGLLAPAVASCAVAIERAAPAEVTLAGGHVIRGREAARKLAGGVHLQLVACTVGDAADRRARELMSEDPVAALAFDGLATAAVNALAGAICRDLRARMAPAGQRTSTPVSPGQAGWDLAHGQRLLFSLVRPERIGLRLSEGGQMQPCKSLSFAVAIGPTVDDRIAGGCAGCAAGPGCHWSRLHDVT